MTRRDALQEGVLSLAEKGQGLTDTPHLDASLLLAAALSTTKEGLLASLPEDISETALATFRELLGRRLSGVPVAYLLKRKYFWGYEFIVDERVLVPRPDTELLVELALELGQKASWRIHEACTGSGCVALSLALERPSWQVSASDLSLGALAVARANAQALVPPDRPGGPVELFQADLLLPMTPPSLDPAYDLILANPPYVESPLAGELAASWGEPLMALDGGPDGLDPYRRLLPQAFEALAPGGWLLVEADPSQAESLVILFTEAGFLDIKNRQDLAGLARVSLGRKPWKT